MQYKLKSLATPGVSQVNINAENLKSISISIPTLTEQEKIVFILQKMDEQKYMESGMKDNLSNLKKGLMQNLLTGKIRVKV
jgi:type I restriction enzyme S subunit